jgi:DNA-binding transcriptional regulator LsrR (DeoR family)
MARNRLGGPAQLVLTASVARRYYIDGRSKIEIADEFGISRFRVARLLDSARTSGLVRIEISYPGVVEVDLSRRLQEMFGLRHAVVIDTPDEDRGSLRQHLGTATADLLSEIVTAEDVLGLAWARSVSAMATALTQLPPTPVVQLTGALSRPDGDDSSVDVVREVARVSGGPAYFFHAPFVVPNAATARALRRQPEVARAFAQFGAVTKAVAGIGRWQPGQSTLYDAAQEDERQLLDSQGVCAEVSGVFIDSDGTPVQTPLNERMIAVSEAQMRAIPEVIGIPYGTAKAPAVRAALRSGLVNGLVTHTSLAAALLAPDLGGS